MEEKQILVILGIIFAIFIVIIIIITIIILTRNQKPIPPGPVNPVNNQININRPMNPVQPRNGVTNMNVPVNNLNVRKQEKTPIRNTQAPRNNLNIEQQNKSLQSVNKSSLNMQRKPLIDNQVNTTFNESSKTIIKAPFKSEEKETASVRDKGSDEDDNLAPKIDHYDFDEHDESDDHDGNYERNGNYERDVKTKNSDKDQNDESEEPAHKLHNSNRETKRIINLSDLGTPFRPPGKNSGIKSQPAKFFREESADSSVITKPRKSKTKTLDSDSEKDRTNLAIEMKNAQDQAMKNMSRKKK